VDHSLKERLFMIEQFSALLGHCASLLPFIAEDEDKHERYHVWVACNNSFTTDLRALLGFLTADHDSRSAHRTDFCGWKPNKKAPSVKRLKRLYTFTHVHRAHLSWERFESERSDLSSKIPADYLNDGRLKAAGYARILTDYPDVLDEFILELPRKSKEQWLFAGASGVARNGVNSFMGLPPAKSLMLDVFGDEPVEGPPF
jgi:hypothetical protein